MADYLLGGPKIPYPWEILSSLLPNFSAPSPAPTNSSGQNVESYQFPFSQLTPESMKLGINAPPAEKPITPAPTPGVNLVTPPPAPAPKSPVELARAEAESLYQQHIKGGKAPTEFGLPWDFFTKHGDISGGVFVGPQGPKFLFNENKPQSMTDMLMPVIQRYAEQMAKIQSGTMNPEEAGKMFATMPNAEQLGAFANLMGAQTTAGKAPAEIANLYSQAYKPQLAQNVYAGGPGEMASLLIPPFGGAPRTLATGMQAEHGANMASLGMAALTKGQEEKSRLLAQSPEFLADPSKVPEKLLPIFNTIDEWTRQNINSLQTMLGANRTPGAATKPSWQTWIAQAKQANPGRSDQELLQYYQQKYGG